MSLGYSARARKVIEDKKIILYEYNCYNIGKFDWQDALETFDGSILIEKDAFPNLVADGEIKEISNDRKNTIDIQKTEEKIDFQKLFHNEKIKIKNCSHTWKAYDGYDFMALKLLWKIFNEYQNNGIIPEYVSWDC